LILDGGRVRCRACREPHLQRRGFSAIDGDDATVFEKAVLDEANAMIAFRDGRVERRDAGDLPVDIHRRPGGIGRD
jgi:hypothetical protein